AGDITYDANGTILDYNGNLYFPPGEVSGTTIFLQIYGWTGNSSTFANGTLKGVTAPFAITLSNDQTGNQPDITGMSALVLIPEPSFPALFALGTFGFALFHRKK
ncbi:MAG TPA: PEP-CTERM sorting domain-containing protein, partial [Verrucomicrobiae bacterium]|nr:PEP-CTERM sorting domain-containing protein [Verrucomicrobiae bacterium]